MPLSRVGHLSCTEAMSGTESGAHSPGVLIRPPPTSESFHWLRETMPNSRCGEEGAARGPPPPPKACKNCHKKRCPPKVAAYILCFLAPLSEFSGSATAPLSEAAHLATSVY